MRAYSSPRIYGQVGVAGGRREIFFSAGLMELLTHTPVRKSLGHWKKKTTARMTWEPKGEQRLAGKKDVLNRRAMRGNKSCNTYNMWCVWTWTHLKVCNPQSGKRTSREKREWEGWGDKRRLGVEGTNQNTLYTCMNTLYMCMNTLYTCMNTLYTCMNTLCTCMRVGRD